MNRPFLLFTVASLLTGTCATQAAAILRITEVMSAGDSTDWFEVTNYGDTAASITGYKMDDSSALFGSSVLLNGISSIGAGESIVFIEGTIANVAGFKSGWNLTTAQVGYYSGSGVGLSGPDGDGVNLFDSIGNNLAQVSFGAATGGNSFGWSYDSIGAKLSGPSLSNKPSSGTNGLTGNPGTLAVPEPSALVLGGAGMLALLRRRRA